MGYYSDKYQEHFLSYDISSFMLSSIAMRNAKVELMLHKKNDVKKYEKPKHILLQDFNKLENNMSF